MKKKTKMNTTVVSMDELVPLMQEVLANGQTVTFSPKGTSMLPMLRQGIDSVVLSPVCGRLEKYDIPLYRRDDGKYVLHRIVGVGDNYTCMGDNQYRREANVRHDQVIAVVTAFYRGDKKHGTSDLGYWLYCRLWYHSMPLRRFWHRGIRWIRRHLK